MTSWAHLDVTTFSRHPPTLGNAALQMSLAALPAGNEVHVDAPVEPHLGPRRTGVLEVATKNDSRVLPELDRLAPHLRQLRAIGIERDEDRHGVRHGAILRQILPEKSPVAVGEVSVPVLLARILL